MGTLVLCLGIAAIVILGVMFAVGQIELYRMQMEPIDILNACAVFSRNGIAFVKAMPKKPREATKSNHEAPVKTCPNFGFVVVRVPVARRATNISANIFIECMEYEL